MTGRNPSRPPLWREPGIIGLVVLVIAASGWVLFEDKLTPPKSVDVSKKVPVAGGGAFCDPVPLPK